VAGSGGATVPVHSELTFSGLTLVERDLA